MKKVIYSSKFYLVDQSPWPFVVAYSILSVVFVFMMFLNEELNVSINWVILFLVLLVIFLSYWFRDVIIEVTFLKKHTIATQKGLKIGVFLFILFLMFFFDISLNSNSIEVFYCFSPLIVSSSSTDVSLFQKDFSLLNDLIKKVDLCLNDAVSIESKSILFFEIKDKLLLSMHYDSVCTVIDCIVSRFTFYHDEGLIAEISDVSFKKCLLILQKDIKTLAFDIDFLFYLKKGLLLVNSFVCYKINEFGLRSSFGHESIVISRFHEDKEDVIVFSCNFLPTGPIVFNIHYSFFKFISNGFYVLYSLFLEKNSIEFIICKIKEVRVSFKDKLPIGLDVIFSLLNPFLYTFFEEFMSFSLSVPSGDIFDCSSDCFIWRVELFYKLNLLLFFFSFVCDEFDKL